MVLIAPSILAADFTSLGRQIALAEEGGADWIHVDVMDGHFVPNITFGPPLVRAVRKCTKLPLDVHLMMEKPERFIDAFIESGADQITVHFETCPHLHRTIQQIHNAGAKAGVSLNPSTPVSLLADVISSTELVLIMSVNPGFGGQTFIPHTIRKLEETAALIQRTNSQIHLQVDGGIDLQTAKAVVDVGADVLVAGSFIFGAQDIPSAVRSLRRSIADA
ncbi:MAG: ribulose-phosphate 3-epimerase [Bacteroidota bacterium]